MAALMDADDMKMLTDIGFIAMSGGLTEHATAIFEAIRAERPGAEAGFLGLGMMQILGGNPGEAVSILKKAPFSDSVNTFLGIALIQSADVEKGKAVLQSVIDNSADTPFARIAQDTLASISGGAAGQPALATGA